MRDPADGLDDPNCLGPSKWWVAIVAAIQGVVVVVCIVLLTGCSSLALGPIGGWAAVDRHIGIAARKAYEGMVWGWDGKPASHTAVHYYE